MSSNFAVVDAATIAALNACSEQVLEKICRDNYAWIKRIWNEIATEIHRPVVAFAGAAWCSQRSRAEVTTQMLGSTDTQQVDARAGQIGSVTVGGQGVTLQAGEALTIDRGMDVAVLDSTKLATPIFVDVELGSTQGALSAIESAAA